MRAGGSPRLTPRRLAIVGLGAVAREIHLPACAKLPEVSVVGGADPQAAGRFSFPVFATAAELLDRTKPELVVVATPPEQHFGAVRQALEAGCHVLCEKPFTTTLAEADELIALAKARARQVVVNNQYRFMAIHAEAKRCIGQPGFGELLFLSAQQSFATSDATEAGWRGRSDERTCREFGTHVLDLCRFFFDEEPRSVLARMPRPAREAGPDYLDLVYLEFSRGRAAHVLLDRLSRGPHRYLSVSLDGSEGAIEAQLGGGARVSLGIRGGSRRPFLEMDVSGGGRARLYQGDRFRTLAKEPLDVFANATRLLIKGLLNALDTGATPPCSAEDNRRTLALMLAAYESARTGAAVPMAEQR